MRGNADEDGAMIRAAIMLAALVGLAGSTSARVPSCRWAVPADVRQRPVAWLGACPAGLADGTGILRAGTREPYDFFLGRMARGRPVDGLIIGHGTEWLVAHGFDGRGGIRRTPDSTAGQFEALFSRGAAAADTLAKRMEAGGNRPSARYYRALAAKVRNALPE
jgi:hypothetical protein